MVYKKVLLIFLICFIFINSLTYGNVNPDGYISTPGIDITINFPEINEELKTQPAFTFFLPLSKYYTHFVSYSNLSVRGYSLNTFLTGFNLHTKSIDSFDQLINPDGLNGSFIFAPTLGLNKTNSSNDFFYGLNVGSVVTDLLTINLSYLVTRDKSRTHHTIQFGTNLHLQNTTIENHINNPDGRFGLITLFPHVAAIIYENRNTNIMTGLYLKSPYNQSITFSFLYDHIFVVDSYNNESMYQFGFGITLYL